MMKKIALLAACLILASCSGMKAKTSQHSTMPLDDNKGNNHFPHSIAVSEKTFIFDPSAGAWAAYNAQGDRVKTGRASGGRSYCANLGRPCRTVSGSFRVFSKRGANCISNRFPLPNGGAPMPYCMFFHGGYAIHGSTDVPDYNASHGCVRVTPSAAQWLDHNFMDIGTRVVVKPY